MNIDNSKEQENKNVIAKAIESMSMMDNESKIELKEATQNHNFQSWKNICMSKSGGVGFLTGLAGGPVGIALEVADTGYLIAMAGRAAYGVGHIHNKTIDYNNDIEGILAIWSGVGKSIDKIGLSTNTLVPIAGKLVVKANAKVGLKLATKMATKLSGKIIAKTSTKIAGKVASKLTTKWIPIIGGIVSAAINAWVLDGLIDAANEYYTSDAILINDNIV